MLVKLEIMWTLYTSTRRATGETNLTLVKTLHFVSSQNTCSTHLCLLYVCDTGSEKLWWHIICASQ